jgi:hypothetical protein
MNLSEQFTYRKPTDEEVAVMGSISDALKQVAKTIELALPPSAERTLALRKLQEGRMWTNAAVIFTGLVQTNFEPVALVETAPGQPVA